MNYPNNYCEMVDKGDNIYKTFREKPKKHNKIDREEIIDFLYELRECGGRKIMGIEYAYIDRVIYDLENRL